MRGPKDHASSEGQKPRPRGAEGESGDQHRDRATGSSALSAAARPVPWSALGGPAPERLRLARHWLVFAIAAGRHVVTAVALPLAEPLQFVYEAPSLHVALETGTAVIGLLATAIVVRGWRDSPRLDRLIIAAALAVIAVTAAALATMLAISPGSGPRGLVGLTGMLDRVAAHVRGRVRARPPARPAGARRSGDGRLSRSRRVAAAAVPGRARARPLARPGAARRRRPDTRAAQPAAGRDRAPDDDGRQLRRRLGRPDRARGPRGGRLRAAARARRAVLRVRQARLRALPAGGPENVHLGDVLRLPSGSCCFGGVLEVRRAVAARAAAARAPPARPRAARRRRAGARLHPPPRRPPGRDARRRRDRRRRRPRAGGLAARDRGAASRPRTSRWRRAGAPRRPPARSECGVEVQVNVRVADRVADEVRAELVRIISEAVRNAAHHGGARHVRVELRARRWPCA